MYAKCKKPSFSLGRPSSFLTLFLTLFAIGLASAEAQALASFPNAVQSGQELNENNTGIPPGHNLSDEASTITVTEKWIKDENKGSRTIENRRFLSGARLMITVEGFTVQYCKFMGKGGLSTNANYGGLPLGKNIKILYCEFDGNNENLRDAIAIDGSSLTLKRVHVQRWPRGMSVGDGDVWVEECYMHDLTCDGKGAHIENIYVAGGANQTYLRNKLISNATYGGDGSQISASLAIFNESYDRGKPYPPLKPLANVRIEGNYFESDGYYAVYCGAIRGKNGKFPTNMIVKDNIFGRQLQRWSGKGGPAAAFDPDQEGNSWQHNTWGSGGPASHMYDPMPGDEVASPAPM
jgi:hypothetical protein